MDFIDFIRGWLLRKRKGGRINIRTDYRDSTVLVNNNLVFCLICQKSLIQISFQLKINNYSFRIFKYLLMLIRILNIHLSFIRIFEYVSSLMCRRMYTHEVYTFYFNIIFLSKKLFLGQHNTCIWFDFCKLFWIVDIYSRFLYVFLLVIKETSKFIFKVFFYFFKHFSSIIPKDYYINDNNEKKW